MPASTQASATALVNANAKGLVGSTPAPARAKAKGASASSAAPMAARHSTVGQVARPAPQTLLAYHAVMPSVRVPMQPVAPQPMTRTGMNAPSTSMR